MTGRFIRDVVNWLLYGGFFIGLCASCITALTLELTGGLQRGFSYVLLIGTATAALYCAHRVIGLAQAVQFGTGERFQIIAKYRLHIRVYCFMWSLISLWLFLGMANLDLILWLLPGGLVAFTYVLPVFSEGRRARDFGWIKILLIGWSWAWLTAFFPVIYFGELSTGWAILTVLERGYFIVALTIPFEIRDITADLSSGLLTMPSKFGLKRSIVVGYILCILTFGIALLLGNHFGNYAYVAGMSFSLLATIWILKKSDKITDDFFFSGLTDGLMIAALLIYWLFAEFALIFS